MEFNPWRLSSAPSSPHLCRVHHHVGRQPDGVVRLLQLAHRGATETLQVEQQHSAGGRRPLSFSCVQASGSSFNPARQASLTRAESQKKTSGPTPSLRNCTCTPAAFPAHTKSSCTDETHADDMCTCARSRDQMRRGDGPLGTAAESVPRWLPGPDPVTGW